ncbi:uncharacterized protein LOC127078840 [Lathyrus oleraceus]|uniref:uncharacterized protein LOC127078840 n=1 Tax=Pisum sativum TaxID=3888 RepID=UPI0021D0492D|nr:uncharacterized protein LOC127078840 [Pisum sativum]
MSSFKDAQRAIKAGSTDQWGCMVEVAENKNSAGLGFQQGSFNVKDEEVQPSFPSGEFIHETDNELVTFLEQPPFGHPGTLKDPSPEVETQDEKDDDSSKSEKEVAAEGLCSLGKNVPSKKLASMSHETTKDIIDLEEESSEEEDDTLVHLVKPSVDKKLRTRKGKTMAEMRTVRREKKVVGVGPSKSWSKVERRIVVERELGKEVVEVKEVMELIKAVGLMKTVVGLPQCCEGLVKEFVVNIPEDIFERISREFCKVFVRGRCVRFSPTIINKFLGRGTNGGWI